MFSCKVSNHAKCEDALNLDYCCRMPKKIDKERCADVWKLLATMPEVTAGASTQWDEFRAAMKTIAHIRPTAGNVEGLDASTIEKLNGMYELGNDSFYVLIAAAVGKDPRAGNA